MRRMWGLDGGLVDNGCSTQYSNQWQTLAGRIVPTSVDVGLPVSSRLPLGKPPSLTAEECGVHRLKVGEGGQAPLILI